MHNQLRHDKHKSVTQQSLKLENFDRVKLKAIIKLESIEHQSM
jgi:hypothetical protein